MEQPYPHAIMIFHKHNILPSAAALLVSCAFATGVFFRGFDQALFSPALLMIFFAAGLMMAHGWKEGWSFPSTGCSIFLALFWAWMGTAVTWSNVPYISTLFTLIIGTVPLLFFATVQHPQADRLIRWQMAGLMTAVAAMAAWAVIQFMFLSDLAGPRIRHPMLNPNNLAVLLTIGVFALLQAFSRTNGWKMAVSGGLAGLLVCGILTTQSRGGMLGLGLGGIVFSVLCWPVLKARWKRFVIATCILAIVTGAIMLTMAERMESIRILGGGQSGMASIHERFLLLQAALRMLAAHPFSGIGLGGFYLAFPPYRHADDLSDGFFVHIDPLQFGIEMGIIAPVLFYGFCAAVLLRTIQALKQSRERAEERLEMVLSFCGLLALLINAHVNFDLYMLPALVLAAVMLSAWYRGTEKILGPARWHMMPGNGAHMALLGPVLLLVLVAAPVWTVRAGLGVRDAGQSAAALQKGDLEAARRHAENALARGPGNYDRTYTLNGLWRTDMLRNHYDLLSRSEREILFLEAQEQFDLAVRYNPYNARALNHQAFLYYLFQARLTGVDGTDRAIALLQKAIEIDPINFDNRIGLATVLDRQGFPDRAIGVLEEGNTWAAVRNYASPAYRTLLIGLKRRTGQEKEADRLETLAREREEIMQRKMKKNIEINEWIRARMKEIQ